MRTEWYMSKRAIRYCVRVTSWISPLTFYVRKCALIAIIGNPLYMYPNNEIAALSLFHPLCANLRLLYLRELFEI